jgi:hypothetical protein
MSNPLSKFIDDSIEAFEEILSPSKHEDVEEEEEDEDGD